MTGSIVKFPDTTGKTFSWDFGWCKGTMNFDEPQRLSGINLVCDMLKHEIMKFQNKEINHVGNHVATED